MIFRTLLRKRVECQAALLCWLPIFYSVLVRILPSYILQGISTEIHVKKGQNQKLPNVGCVTLNLFEFFLSLRFLRVL